MVMSAVSLKELIETAKQSESDDAVIRLTEAVGGAEQAALSAEADSFRELFELWSDEISHSENKAALIVKLAEKSVMDDADFRTALHYAVRKLLPPYLASGSVVKAIGARDTATGVRDAALRLRKLQHLRSTALMYHQETKQWSKINGIDKVTGTIAVAGLQSSNVSSIPLSNAVLSAYFFNTTPDFINLLYPSARNLASSAEYRRLFTQNSLSEISAQKIRDIVFALLVPACFTPEAFEAWWSSAPAAAAASAAGKRGFAEARSILELHTLLAAEEKISALDEAAAGKLEKLFQRIRRDISPKDVANLTECIALIAEPETAPDLLKKVFAPLRGKVPFWPAEISEKTPLAPLEAWGRLSVKYLPGFIKASLIVYSRQEMAVMATKLPLRCVGVLLDVLKTKEGEEDVVTETLLKVKQLSADMILWIWKNRTHVSSRLADEIDMGHVLNAISAEGLPKEWTAAQRELKRALFEKADFQKFVIENANGDIPSIIAAIQRCRSFQGGERQSVLVKLGRHSEELKAFIEAGEGRRMMGDAAQTPDQAPVTSVASHRRLAAELENLINVQIPENAAAVALARSYGDLRENAEYDAAKEKRRFLHRRRAELEKTLGFIRSTDFKDVVIDGQVVIGSLVRLESASGSIREYYVLGAWDGDPERNRISYKTRIGEVLMDKKIGDKVEIPEAGSYTIKEILPLPEELRKELAGEE